MARKGNQKVKTGCLTCKIRKVKCDETKPNCQKCSSTKRKCDGYPAKRQGEYSWSELLNNFNRIPLSLRSGINNDEARALNFFRNVVAPVFSEHSTGYFWTQLVAQIGQQEIAVHHAVIAISSMYEHAGNMHRGSLETTQGLFAISQYNMALKELTSCVKDENIVIVVCILFICIEILQDNKEAAIGHCRHGVMILNKSSGSSDLVREYILPIFLRLSVFPFFFGANAESFPGLDDVASDVNSSFTALENARFVLDSLVSRSIRFIRSVDIYRLNVVSPASIPTSLYEDQVSLEASLDVWQKRFSDFIIKNTAPLDALGSYLILQMKYLVAKIWVKASLDCREMAYDHHLAAFQEIVGLAHQIQASKAQLFKTSSKPKFVFEMGYMPLLYFTVIKCRNLNIRLAALCSMKILSVSRESLWDISVMYAVGRRVIEIEHGMTLETAAPEKYPAFESQTPLAEIRIMDSVVTKDIKIRVDVDGQSKSQRKVCFFIWSPGNRVSLVNEWVTIYQEPRAI